MLTNSPKIYIASNIKYAPTWREARDEGLNLISSWVDVGKIDQARDFRDLWVKCISEVRAADLLILYCEPGDTLQGCLVEIGAAFASGLPVYCIGRCSSIDSDFKYHPLWNWADNIEDALTSYQLRAIQPQIGSTTHRQTFEEA